MDNIYKAVGYVRLSREDGDNLESESIYNQKQLIKQFVNDRNIILKQFFVDDGFSGGNFNRPAFKEMINYLEKDQANMVITKDLSRLGRDYIGTGFYLEHYFPEHRIRYYAILDCFDSFDSTTTDMTPIKVGLNDMYAKDISKKVRSALYSKKRHGFYTGSIACFGYLKDPLNKGLLIVDPKTEPIVKLIYQLFINGKTTGEIAQILTTSKKPTPIMRMGNNRIKNLKNPAIWNSQSVRAILQNEMLTGTLIQGKSQNVSYKSKKRQYINKKNWIICPNNHPAIISRDVFNLVQKRLIKRKHRNSNNKSLLLSGLLYCFECHSTIGLQYRNNGKLITTVCNYYKKNSKQKLCSAHYYHYDQIEKIITNKLQLLLNDNKIKNQLNQALKQIFNSYQIKLKKIKTDINKKINLYKKKLDILYEDRLDEIISYDFYLKKKKEIIDEIEILKLNKMQYSSSLTLIDLKAKISLILSSLSKDLIARLINRIEISELGEIRVFYQFK